MAAAATSLLRVGAAIRTGAAASLQARNEIVFTLEKSWQSHPAGMVTKSMLQRTASRAIKGEVTNILFSRRPFLKKKQQFMATALAVATDPGPSTTKGSAAGNSNVVFTTPGCPYCRRAKSTLKELEVPFLEVDVGSNQPLRNAIVEATNHRTVPVIFLNGEYIGGSDSLQEIVDSGKLKGLLEAPAKSLPEVIQAALAAPLSEKRVGGEPSSPEAKPGGAKPDVGRREQLVAIVWKMQDAKTGVERKSVRDGLVKLANCMSGDAAVAWLRANVPEEAGSESSAVALGKELQEAGLLHHATFSGPFTGSKHDLFRLHADEPRISKSFNASTVWLKPTRPANEVAEDLRRRVLALYDEALSPDGRSVQYTSIAGSHSFAEYVEATGELQRVDLFALTVAQKMAFFINLYNSLVIHAMVTGGSPSTLLDRLSFYRSSKYFVGGHDYSLDDIENGILRGNRSPPSSLTGSRPFGPTDPRRFHAVLQIDPRLHFALNCGAKSCPPIKLYTADNLDEALTGASEAFLEGEVEVNVAKHTVTLSKILDWYKVDFGSTPEERLLWIKKYVSKSKQAEIDEVLKSGKVAVEYRKYDWALND